MNPKVDAFFSNLKTWKKELEMLRNIVLDCGLVEELKWGVPCYTYNGSNIVLIHGFKQYCALLFMKGALLNDTEDILIQQTENVQSGRQIRFTSAKQINDKAKVLKAYIFEAIEVEKAGLKVEFTKSKNTEIPEELLQKMDKNPALKKAFEALTPGRQRAYNLFISAAKQSKTRESRIDENTHRILKGKGLHDCVCGLSKRMPQCDGSHKLLNKNKIK